MKIIQLIQKPQLRGAEIFACQLSNHLNAMGETAIVVSVFEGEAVLPFSGKLIQLNRPLKKRLWDFDGWRQFARIVGREKPEIIQANAGDTLKFAVLSKLFFGWKTPLVFRNANKMGDFINTKPKLWLNAFFIRHVTHVVSVSELCRNDFIDTFDFSEDKIETIPIGIEEQVIPENPPADIAEIFKHKPILVNVGSLVKEKNHIGLFRIFRKILAAYSDAQLLIIGNGPLRVMLEDNARELGISEHIHFLGYRTDIMQIVKQTDAFLMPSLIEGLPGVILETFYCKIPVVANNVGGISEIVKNDETGWLVDKNDEARFVEAVKLVLNNRSSKSEILTNAYRLVLSKFKNDIISKKFLNVYREIASS